MKIYDVTVPIKNEMPVWPGDPAVQNHLISAIQNGDEANVTCIRMSAHTGTHIDAPRHFIESGETIDNLDLNILMGEMEIIDIDSSVTLIEKSTLEAIEKHQWKERVFFKTRNSSLKLLEKNTFTQDFTALSPDAAEYLIHHGVRLVGIDYLSIAPFENGAETHVALLQKSIIVVEGLNLSEVPAGIYDLIALPILLRNADGAPARVLLIQQ